MATDLDEVARVLQKVRPNLSDQACRNMAAQVLGIVDSATRRGRDVARITLTPSGGGKGADLGAILQQHRNKRGLTQEQVAAHFGWHVSKVIRIEKGEVGIASETLLVLMNLYGITDPQYREHLRELARQTRAKRP